MCGVFCLLPKSRSAGLHEGPEVLGKNPGAPSPSRPHLPPPLGAAAKTWRAPHQGRSTAHAQCPHRVRVASRFPPARAVEPGTGTVIARQRQQPSVAPAFWAGRSYRPWHGSPWTHYPQGLVWGRGKGGGGPGTAVPA